jgi:hypothetical protein
MTDQAANADKRFVEVTLDNPLVRGAQTIDKVTLRKPNGGHLRGVKMVDVLNMDVLAASKVIPRISDPSLTQQDLLAMDAEDVANLAGELAGFLLTKQQKADAGLEA